MSRIKDMSRDLVLKLSIISGTLLAATTLSSVLGLTFAAKELFGPCLVIFSLGPAAVFYQKRNIEPCSLCATAVLLILVYFSCFTVLMYSAAAVSFPFVDDALVAWDSAMGFHVPSIIGWSDRHPLLSRFMAWCYDSTIFQTLFVVLFLGCRGERRPLEGFVLQFMLSLAIAALIFCYLPAEGPFVAFGYEPSPGQAQYLQHLREMRSGERTIISLTDCEGLVTFPSFHTTWAILLAFSVRHRRRLFVPMAALNAVVVAATLTTGWHYVTDVIGGIILAVLVILLSRCLQPWLYPGMKTVETEDCRL